MNLLNGIAIGDVHITVYQATDNKQFFYLKADNKNVLPVLDFIDKNLINFKANNC